MKRLFTVITIVISTIGGGHYFISQASAADISLGVTQGFLEFSKDNNGIPYTEATFEVSGGSRADINFEITDIYIDSSGSKQMLELGSTPNSPRNYFSLGKYNKSYKANGKKQDFTVRLTLEDPLNVNQVINGGLKIEVDPTPYAKNGTIRSSTGAVLTFVYIPPTVSETELKPGISLSDVRVEKIAPKNFIDRFIPDLPPLVHSGPVAVTYQRKNTGNIFMTVADTVSITPRGFISKGESETVSFIATTENRLLIPEQNGLTTIPVVDQTRNTNQQVDPLKWGIYTVRIESLGKIDGEIVLQKTYSRALVIFPWKNALIVVLVVGPLLYLRKRKRKVVPTPITIVDIPKAPAKKAPAKKAPAKKAPAKKAPAKKAPAKKAPAKKAPAKKAKVQPSQ